ncbi:MAG: hypothetical protein ACE5J2_00935 [Nitrososphaerales archaeon]
MLDLYKTLRLVEDEIVEMKKRQQVVLGSYQQQTREDIVKKFAEADHIILEASEKKIKEIDSIKQGTIYLITSAKKVAYISARRIKDESELSVEIDPIVYPTPYNLKFILKEPSIGLYSPSNTQGTFSANTVTPIRAVDVIQPMQADDLENYLDFWITHKANDTLAIKLKAVEEKIKSIKSSAEILVESLLLMSSQHPPRQLICYCEDHDYDPTHNHERTVPPTAVKGLLKHHLKLN